MAQPQGAPTAPMVPTAVAGMVPGEDEMTGDRTMKGFTFHYPRLIDNPFTAWNFYVGSSIEFYHQKGAIALVPTVTGTSASSTQTLEFDRNITFAKLHFGFDVRPAKIFTFGLDADYIAEVAVNSDTLFTHGAQGGFDFRPNLKFRFFQLEKAGSQMGLRAHGTFQQGIRLSPQGLLTNLSRQIREISNSPDTNGDGIPDRVACLVTADFGCAFEPDIDVAADLQAKRSRNGGGGALAFAQAINRYLGGQLALGLEGAKTSVTLPFVGAIDSSELVFYAGISPAINIYPKFPLGLIYEYRIEVNKSSFSANPAAGISSDSSITALSHKMNWALQYTGRRDLMLGFIAAISFLQDTAHSMQRATTDPRAFVGAVQFDLRYFF
jgi:hypothetical protein